jgi:phage terminase large subunit-like protein
MGKRSDDTAIVVIGVDADNYIFILDIACFKTDKISDYFKEIAQLHSKWEFKKLRAEVTVAQTVIVRDLKDRMRAEGLSISIDEFRPNRSEGSKEERIAAALEHRYENREIWHYKGGYTDVLEEQLVQARPAHDDIKDALAAAVSIAIKPKSKGGSTIRENIIPISSRFGGVAFR